VTTVLGTTLVLLRLPVAASLSVVRQGWEEIERAEARLPYRLTARESLRQWLQMQQVFEPQLRAMATLFGMERQSALAELKFRLRRRALRELAMLFVRDLAETRVDLLLADIARDVQAIRRGQSVEVEPGTTICVCSPEDLIIYKSVSTRLRDHGDAAKGRWAAGGHVG